MSANADDKEVIVSVPSDAKPGEKTLCHDAAGRGYNLFVPDEALPGDRLVLRFSGEEDNLKVSCTILRTTSEADTFDFFVPAWAVPGETLLDVQNAFGQSKKFRVPPNVKPADKMHLALTESGDWQCKLIKEQMQKITHPKPEAWANMPPLRGRPVDTKVAYDKLVHSIRVAGGFVSAKMDRAAVPPVNVWGLVAVEQIAAGEELVRIPADLQVSRANIEKLLPQVCPEVEKVAAFTKGRCKSTEKSIFLAHLLHAAEDRLCGADEAGLSPAMTEVRDRIGDPKKWEVWQRYADELIGLDFSSHPYVRAALDPENYGAELEPSNEGESMLRIMLSWQEVMYHLQEHCPADVLGTHFGDARMFLQALLIHMTRAFQIDKGGAWCPIIDDFNHSTNPGVWYYQDSDGTMVAQASRAHQPGEELFDSYGDRPNPNLYCTYGFTVTPELEPSWSYEMSPVHVPDIYQMYLNDAERHQTRMLDLSSKSMTEALCDALNACNDDIAAGSFLSLVCSRCQSMYHSNQQLQPALEALDRARAKQPRSSEWWTELAQEDLALATKDIVRVKMSEYLCLTAHLEAVACAEGWKSEDMCLERTAKLRQLIGSSLATLRAGGRLDPQQLTETFKPFKPDGVN